MGQLVGSLQSSCCQLVNNHRQLSTQLQDSATNKQFISQILADDDYFFAQDWFGEETNFAPEKFIFNYPLYRPDQERMLAYWDKTDIQNMRHGIIQRSKGQPLSSKWMYLIRKYYCDNFNIRGTPCSHIRPIILDLFKLTFHDCALQYRSVLSVVFKNRDFPTSFKNVPLFGLQESFEEEFEGVLETDRKLQLLIQNHMLSEQGIQALVRLLWVIHQQYHQVEYNPMLLQLAQLMLIFLKEEQAFCALQWMIEDSAKMQQDQHEAVSLRWHIVLSQQHFNSFAQSFYETVAAKSKSFQEIFNHFKTYKFDYIELFHDMTTKLFITYLPFSLVIKVFVMFLNEGVKIYYRISYAIVRMLKNEILKVKYPGELKYLIRKGILNYSLAEQDMLIKKAFSLRLNKQQNIQERQSLVQKTQTYYLPIPSHPSSIMQYEEFETIWEWLPETYKLCNPHMVFSSVRDGYSLRNLLRCCSTYEKWPILLVMTSVEQTTFGVFCDQMLQLTKKPLGTNDTFVFMLKPERRRFMATGKNNTHLLCGEKFLQFGDEGEGPALVIDDDLSKGQTNKSDTYANLRLNGDFAVKGSNQIRCLSLEAFAIL